MPLETALKHFRHEFEQGIGVKQPMTINEE
jgi:hypothetical protein